MHVQQPSRIGAEPSMGVTFQIAVAVAGGRTWFEYQTFVRVRS